MSGCRCPSTRRWRYGRCWPSIRTLSLTMRRSRATRASTAKGCKPKGRSTVVKAGLVVTGLGALAAAFAFYMLVISPLPPERGADIGAGMLVLLAAVLLAVGMAVLGTAWIRHTRRQP